MLALAPAASAADTTVEIVDFVFVPSTTTIEVGDSVTWSNRDSAPHDATGDGWSTPLLVQGESASVTFEAAGTFGYICSVHPDMTGSVTVAAAAGGGDDGDGDGDGGNDGGGAGDGGEAPTITDPPTDTVSAPTTENAAGAPVTSVLAVLAASAAAFLAALRVRGRLRA